MWKRACSIPLLALLGAGCESYYREYRELPVEDLEFAKVWRACLDTAATEFPVDPRKVDPGLKQFTTAWRTKLRAFSRGRRRRAHFEIESENPRKHVVRYWVERQAHGEIGRPMKPQEADWDGDGQDVAVETRLRHHLRLRLAQAAGRPLPGVEGVRIEDPMRRRSADRR